MYDMITGKMATKKLLVVGHSYVKRLEDYLRAKGTNPPDIFGILFPHQQT